MSAITSNTSSAHVMPTYGRLPIALSHGEGCYVWDTQGNTYLDALAGIAVNTLGHAHPKLVAALQAQIKQLIHVSNYYHIPQQEALAAKLTQLSGMDNAFFCNSGLEANEAAIKIARKYGNDKGIANPKIVVCEKAFHGRSLATLSASGNPKIKAGFEPLVEGFIRVPLNDAQALKNTLATHTDIVAVLLEPVQGEGGVHAAASDYLQQVRQLCDTHNCLMMLDEVQCGIARTGKWFAHQWADVVPDVMTLAKGLGSGVPIGAVLAAKQAAGVLQAGNHGSTFGGNPLAMCAGVHTLRIVEEENLLHNAHEVGNYLQKGLRHTFSQLDGVQHIRGQGLMLGVELAKPCAELQQQALAHNLLIGVTANNVIRLVPPLIFTQAEADELLEKLTTLVHQFLD